MWLKSPASRKLNEKMVSSSRSSPPVKGKGRSGNIQGTSNVFLLILLCPQVGLIFPENRLFFCLFSCDKRTQGRQFSCTPTHNKQWGSDSLLRGVLLATSSHTHFGVSPLGALRQSSLSPYTVNPAVENVGGIRLTSVHRQRQRQTNIWGELKMCVFVWLLNTVGVVGGALCVCVFTQTLVNGQAAQLIKPYPNGHSLSP